MWCRERYGREKGMKKKEKKKKRKKKQKQGKENNLRKYKLIVQKASLRFNCRKCPKIANIFNTGVPVAGDIILLEAYSTNQIAVGLELHGYIHSC